VQRRLARHVLVGPARTRRQQVSHHVVLELQVKVQQLPAHTKLF
jgi:hypothetical protein